jgi:hypothetical protein
MGSKPAQVPDSNADQGVSANAPMKWLRQYSAVVAVLGATAAATLELLQPTILIPEPLTSIRSILPLIAVFGLIVSWKVRQWTESHSSWVYLIGGLAFFVLIFARLFFVREVNYTTPDETIYYLIGTEVVDPELRGLSDQEVINHQGETWSDLRQVWGRSFVAVAITYVTSMLIFIQSFLMLVTIMITTPTGAGETGSESQAAGSGSEV